MRIDSSAIAMASNRKYEKYEEKKKATLVTTKDKADSLKLSDESKNLVEQLEEGSVQIKEQEKEREKQNIADLLARQQERSKKVEEEGIKQKSPAEIKLEVLKRMLEALKRMNKNNLLGTKGELEQLQMEYKSSSSFSFSFAGAVGVNNGAQETNAPNGATQWKKITATSAFTTEVENTAYTAQGVVKTADGREISFGVSVEMSRAFCQKYESLVQEDYICTDPLVINLDSNVASVSDQKFLFDLDGDGKKENISFTGKGSGFLALDKNGDGKINDGNELFGTKSGDGFKDLARYDKDGNGWIDEADDVFEDLKIWTKDEQGNDKLLTLKEAGVGAIYLGKASTEFSLNNRETNQTNAIIRSTGVYLKESGEVGTVQHVDLVV